ncbi:MAG: hypothetical protein WKF99_06640 [Solirubrobacteraceae bacterium]
MRLGKMERWLLYNAPNPEALFGLVLDQDSPRTRETLRRAMVKLEAVGLLERHRMRVYVRARDERGEGLIFRDGRFWRRADPTRAHAVRRNVVWQSSFGFQIVLRYDALLASGESIRWDARTVNRALEASGTTDRDHRRVQLAAREEDERDAVVLADRSRRTLVPEVPAEVCAIGQVKRWDLAVVVASSREPGAKADDLWQAALELWRTSSTEALCETVARLPRRAATPNERFRRRSWSLLGG